MSRLTGEEWLHSSERRHRDIRYASALLPVVAPLGATGLALAQTVDGKGALFKQERIGRDNQMFTIYKTRTQLTAGIPTSIGRALRFCSVDELPQLYNVLKGDMSLFGPRPLMESEREEMKQALPANTFDRWDEAYAISGPGCISSFGHDSHRHGRHWEREEFLVRRAELDIHDFDQASPTHDRHLLYQVAVTAAHMLLNPSEAKY
ncbi:MAG TPA: sugar transferase [Candidatus Saccharimonadia bacterium]|nr:sugar transferase [Candidatus Saccharimonadia bacterium]